MCYLDAVDFWTRLDQLIKAKGLTRKEVAEELGFNVNNFGAWKSRKAYPRVGRIEELANLLDVSFEHLSYGDPNTPPDQDTDRMRVHVIKDKARTEIQGYRVDRIESAFKALAGQVMGGEAEVIIPFISAYMPMIIFLGRIPEDDRIEVVKFLVMKVERYELDVGAKDLFKRLLLLLRPLDKDDDWV